MAGIVHKAVKASGDKGLHTEWNDDHEITDDVECEQHQHKEHIIENRTGFPAGPVIGQIIYRTDEKKLYIWDGAAWGTYIGGPATAFTTISCPAGTDPVAELIADTLNLTAGEGIDIIGNAGTDTVDIACEDSAVGNKGVVIVAEGEGIDVAYAGGTATVSGEDATVANKGIASFNTNDFTVAAGAVSLKSKTSYVSIPGTAFMNPNDATQTHTRDPQGAFVQGGTTTSPLAEIQIPHGAVITGAVMYGSDATEEWELNRVDFTDGTPDELATANINTEDATIANATVDNSRYGYFFRTRTTIEGGDEIWGARITYTTDYD